MLYHYLEDVCVWDFKGKLPATLLVEKPSKKTIRDHTEQ